MNPNTAPYVHFEQTQAREFAQFANRQIEKQGIPVDFPPDVEFALYEAAPCANRKDLRWLDCLTIDCSSTKDMDDAVSLSPIDGGFVLGVHIADVAAYVQPGSRIDEIASDRGTSIYLPDRTIPMLPSELSANLCSLNPGEERNAVTVLIALDDDAKVTGYDISKSVVVSRIKGTYDEVNRILSRTATQDDLSKYSGFETVLHEMNWLAEKLLEDRIAAGAKMFDNCEPSISIAGDRIDISYKPRGRAESIIEEFMVLANRIVAEYFDLNGLPTIFRSQSTNQTLAKYDASQSGHANLALERYVHFTSPIRRIADLKVHQILSLFLDGCNPALITESLNADLTATSELATKRSRRADGVQKSCSKFCCRLYFKDHEGEVFDGEVVGFGKNNRPIILISKIHVRVYGPIRQGLKIGQKLSFCVNVNDKKNETTAYRVRPLRRTADVNGRPKRHRSRTPNRNRPFIQNNAA